MRPAHSALLSLVITLLFVSVVGCSTSPSASSGQFQGSPAPVPSPLNITTNDLKKLRWIEGTWRGTGEVQPPFFERYKFENDSTLVMEELADESLSKVNSTTRYELKDGRFGTDRAVATALDETSVTFSPLIPGRNSFRWESESKDSWKAILTLPASGSKPAKETIYKLERLK